MAKEITGVVFPLQVDPVTKNLKVASGADLIEGHIKSVLQIEPFENPMREPYGTPGVLFESQQNFSQYVATVRRSLEREIPSAQFVVSGSLGDSGEGLIEVDWTYLPTGETARLQVEIQ